MGNITGEYHFLWPTEGIVNLAECVLLFRQVDDILFGAV